MIIYYIVEFNEEFIRYKSGIELLFESIEELDNSIHFWYHRIHNFYRNQLHKRLR